MTHKERMRTVLWDKEIPDKVPHGDQTVDPQIARDVFKEEIPEEKGNFLLYWMTETFNDRFFERHLRLRELLGFDFAHVFPTESVKDLGHNDEGHPIVGDVWGSKLLCAPQSTEIMQAAIPDLSKAADYKFPEVEDFSFDNLDRWINESDLFVLCQFDAGFFKISNLVGFDNYVMGILEHKDELKMLMERLVDFQIKMAKEVVKRGADCIWLSNDCAYNSGPFISPELLWELDFQFEKRLIDEIHRLGVPVGWHSCGNQDKTLDMLADIGIDALHSMQPAALNDIRKIKKRYGDKFALVGNVDINELMPNGSVWEIDQTVKNLIKDVGSGGGYVLSTCNGIMEDVPVENALAMHLACEKYGHYEKR
jgi:uroporphyrinogen decarboxylase